MREGVITNADADVLIDYSNWKLESLEGMSGDVFDNAGRSLSEIKNLYV